MKTRSLSSQRGFTLLELMVASAIGLLAIWAMTSLFKQGMDATFVITQRAETQQNMRAAIELMTKDISLAGSGLPSGGLQLPTGGTLSKFACNQTGTCYVPTDTYPNNASAGTSNYMYGILPGFNNGVENGAAIVNAPGRVNDSITSVYCDYSFPLSNFAFSFPNTTQATVAPAAIITAGLPTNILAPGGLNVGDLIFFLVSSPGNGTGNQGTSLAQTAAVVGEITGLPNSTTINFAASDALNFNQTGPNSLASAQANLNSAPAGNVVTACRLNVVTYFLEVPAAGGTVQSPRLMRQVNGLPAVPVADNIINLQITYDVINSNLGTISANQADPLGAGLSPALIQKVNLWIMGESLLAGGTRSQSMYLASSVSASNMSFCNSYSTQNTVCQ
ncbi:MAG TPA: prepilin-type N-terminal cleavage/methylation domain-containing protein [Candidatus Aquilonibacter sp.]|nr:prepilin-type N-terminal cleavage/methylation domain-containing protein [Candidatus Aquilonibacter sp.]